MRIFLMIPVLLLLVACDGSGGKCREGEHSEARLVGYCCGTACWVHDYFCTDGVWVETGDHCDCFCQEADPAWDTPLPGPDDVSADDATDAVDVSALDTDSADGDDGTTDTNPTDTGETDSGSDDTSAGDTSEIDGTDVPDDVTELDSADTTDATPGPCPPEMALVNDLFCVDQYEARLEEWVDGAWVASSPYATVGTRRVRAVVARGEVPQGYISGAEAAEACSEAGKRLCSNDEWLAACRGPENSRWPYGDTYDADACNDSYADGHPVVNYFGTTEGIWDAEHMNDSGINQQAGTVSSGGEMTACVSAWGIYDLHGNLHEWTSDPAGTFRGGFYADGRLNGQGCTYVTTAHSLEYHDYSTGFRCCADRE